MCTAAIPILTSVTGFAQNVASQQAQISQQKAQQAAYTQQKNAEWEIAKRQQDDEASARHAATVINLMQLQHREQETNIAAATEKSDIAMSADKAKALAKLGAIEAGASGISADRLVASVDQEASRRIANVETSRQNQVGAIGTDKLATINQAKVQPIYRNPVTGQAIGSVNYATAALSGLSTGLNYVDFSSYNRPTSSCNPCDTTSRFR